MHSRSDSDTSHQSLADLIFQAEGELARLCREKAWSDTPLGPIEAWPASLRSTASLVVASPVPMIVLWGPELVQIYNDGYREVMGKKHPAGLGQPSRECWPEVWEFTAPLYEGVVNRRESFQFEDQCFVIDRHGHQEEAFFTLSYSPAINDAGDVGGVLVTVSETTAAVERARMEEARRESEERLFTALEAADLGMWDLDLATDAASVRSLRHDQIFGYQELQPEWGQEIAMRHVLAEDQAVFQEAFTRAVKSGVLSCEVRVRWPDGSIHWIEALGRTYYDSDGRAVRMAGVVADVTERNQAEALRQSKERFRLMADSVPQIVWITDPEGRVEFFNRQWSDYTGKAFEPATAAEIAAAVVHPDDVAITVERFEKARSSGGTFLVEHRIRSAAGNYRWFLVRATPYRDPNSGQISRWFGVSTDIHDRKLAEEALTKAAETNTFRVEIDSALRPLADPVEIQAIAARVLGEHLGASRVLYAEVSPDGEYVLIHADYCDGVASIVGRYRLEDYGPTLIAEFRAGRTLVVDKVAEDPRLDGVERESTAALGVGAHCAVPLIKGGRAVALLVIHQSESRVWTDTEVALIGETAERTWAAVERAQAEAALRQSEARYRTLFETMDQGFGIAEMVFDATGRPADFRWLETNPAFERHTGFVASADTTVLELIPDLERHWVEIYGRVAVTGEPERFVEASEVLGRWFEVYAFPIGEPEQRRVAVLFTDITTRKRAE